MMNRDAKKMREQPPNDCEQGFMLLGLIVAIAIILIVLGAAATARWHSVCAGSARWSLRAGPTSMCGRSASFT